MTARVVTLLYCDHCGRAVEDRNMYELRIATAAGTPVPDTPPPLHFCSGACLRDYSQEAAQKYAAAVPETLESSPQANAMGTSLPESAEELRGYARSVLGTITPLSSNYENRLAFAQVLFRLAFLQDAMGLRTTED